MNKYQIDLRNEKRFNSVRSLPNGQFNKYRQMFDSLTRRKEKQTENNDKLLFKTTSTQTSNDINRQSNQIQVDSSNFKLSILKESNNNIWNDNSILDMPFTDDEKTKRLYDLNERSESYLNNIEKFEIEMDKIFDGVSDETNILLNSLCTNNKQIAEFFNKKTDNQFSSNLSSDNSHKTDQLTDISISSFLSETSSMSSSTGSVNTHKKNLLISNYNPSTLYSAIQTKASKSITQNASKTSLNSSSNSSFTSIPIKSCPKENNNRFSITIEEPNDAIVSYVIEMDKEEQDSENRQENIQIDQSDKTESSELFSESSLSIPSDNSKNQKNVIGQVASNVSIIEQSLDTNYIELDDIEFSDDSYEYDGLKKSVQILTPPPKPARTFEHDIYVESRSLIKSRELSTSCILNTNKKKENRTNKVKSLCFQHDNVYETLSYLELDNNNNNNKTKSKVQKKFNVFNEILLNQTQNKKINQKTDNALLSPSKLAISAPNLTELCQNNKKNKNELFLKPFGKIFNHFKKTLSRKTENNETELRVNFNTIQNLKLNENVTLRNKNAFTKSYVTKSYIYSDLNELNLKIKTLFDCVLIVGIKDKKLHSACELDSSEYIEKTTPIIMWKYPENEQSINHAIPEFCFPDLENRNEFKKNESEIFQFTLTNFDGKRTYGYCIRLCIKSKNPIVICIISEIDALEMYYTILSECEKIYKTEGLDVVKTFFSSIYRKSFPNRGETLLVTLGLTDKKEIVLNRSIDRRLEHINLYKILNYPFDFIIKIFASMLNERKVIFLSNKLSSLSSTIQAFETLLYPFNWPHTYIPVLPSYLLEMTEAPTPYIIGLMRSCKNDLLKYKGIYDMLIVDLDKQKFIQENNNEMKILPESIVKILKIDLHNLSNNSKTMSNYEKNVELCKIFLKVFLKTVGNYKNYIVPCTDEEGFKFLDKEFIENAKSDEIKNFLEMFIYTQLFEVFITKKLIPGAKFGLMFDEAIRQDQIQSKLILNNSPKVTTIKQLSNIFAI